MLDKKSHRLLAIVNEISFSLTAPITVEFYDDVLENKIFIEKTYQTKLHYYMFCEGYLPYFQELRVGNVYKVLRGGR